LQKQFRLKLFASVEECSKTVATLRLLHSTVVHAQTDRQTERRTQNGGHF